MTRRVQNVLMGATVAVAVGLLLWVYLGGTVTP